MSMDPLDRLRTEVPRLPGWRARALVADTRADVAKDPAAWVRIRLHVLSRQAHHERRARQLRALAAFLGDVLDELGSVDVANHVPQPPAHPVAPSLTTLRRCRPWH